MADVAKAAEVAKEAEVVVQLRNEFPTPVVLLDGTWGTVALFGTHLLSPQTLNMVRDIFSAWDEWILSIGETPRHHGVHSILFRDDCHPRNANGETIFAQCLPTVGGISVNLEHIFTCSFEDAIETPSASIHSNIFSHIMLAIMHEIDHLATLYNEPPNEGAIEPGEAEKLEAQAYKFSEAFSMFLCQNYEVSPGAMNEEPFFGQKVLGMLQESAADEQAPDDEKLFYKKQQKMVLEGIMYWPEVKEDEQPIILKSYREYMHWVSGEEADDPKWKKVYEKPVQAAPVVEPETPAPEPAAPVGPPPAAEPAPPAQAPVVEQAQAPVVEQNVYTGASTEIYDDLDSVAVSMMGEEPPWEQETDDMARILVDDDTPPAGQAPYIPPANTTQQAPPAPPQQLMANSSGMAHGLTVAQIQDCSWAVYRRLFNNLFTVCEPVKIDVNTSTRPDSKGVGCGGFNNIQAINAPVAITDIPNWDKLFVQMDTNINGRYQKGAVIKGTVSGAQTGPWSMLPKYDLYLINAEGHMELRSLIPQNPWKQHKKCPSCKKGNKVEAMVCVQCQSPLDAIPITYTKPAIEAQGGKFIMYVYAPNNVMKMKFLGETDSNGVYREWIEDPNWNVIG